MLPFSLLAFLAPVVLASQILTQTRWFDGVNVTLQPRFWPALILALWTIFAGVQAAICLKQSVAAGTVGRDLLPVGEFIDWVRPIEFAFYFVVYALLVPWLGYLLSTLVVMVLLGVRVGYRSAAHLFSLAGIALLIVLIFKTGLQVRMPSGQLYELFPPALRNFLIQHF